MLESIPARAFLDWQSYAQIEPWRLNDEQARTYPPPRPEDTHARMGAWLAQQKAKKRR